MAATTKIEMPQGADQLLVHSGGLIDVESGASLKLAGTAIAATAAEINKLAAATPGVSPANFATVADLGIGAEGVLRMDVADAATQNIDVAMPYKVRVIDAWGFKSGGAGGAANTVKLQNVTTDITDAMVLNISDNVRFTVGTLDDAQQEIAAGANLRVVTAKAGGNCAFRLYVRLVRVA